MKELKVVGKAIPRLDAAEKVTGRAKFGSDFKMSGMLYAKVLASPYPHAKILSIDTSKAESLTGVRAVVTSKDMPPVAITPLLGDHYMLCQDNVVRCVGDPVAAVAADSIEIAEEIVGDAIERVVSWKNKSDVSAFSGKVIRLRFVMKDADLYSIRIRS